MKWADVEPFLISYAMLLGPNSERSSDEEFMQMSYAKTAAEEIIRTARQNPETDIFYLLERFNRKMEKEACHKYGTYFGVYCSVAHDIGQDIYDILMFDAMSTKGDK